MAHRSQKFTLGSAGTLGLLFRFVKIENELSTLHVLHNGKPNEEKEDQSGKHAGYQKPSLLIPGQNHRKIKLCRVWIDVAITIHGPRFEAVYSGRQSFNGREVGFCKLSP